MGFAAFLLCRKFRFVFLNPFILSHRELSRDLRMQSCRTNFHWRFTHSFLFRYVSQPPPLRGTSFHRKEGVSCPRIASPYRHFERKREIFFVCGQEETGEHRKTGNTVLYTLLAHGVSFAKEKASGQRKSALGCAYKGRLFLIAMLFSISNFKDP